MAILARKRDEQERGGMGATPEAAPTKRVGSEAPIGSVTAGPSAGKSVAEFTQTQQGSPGSVFKRQLEGADIKGITSLAERPLAREAGQELGRVAGEGIEYKTKRAQQLAEQPQFAFDVKEGDKTVDNTQKIIEQIMAGGKDYETAQNILNRSKIEVPAFSTRNIKEFTPLQALRGGTVEGLLQKEARGPYSTGMAGLDALLFRQKGGAEQLAKKGMGLQAGGQVFADVLQGRSSGVVPEATKTLLEKLGISVPSGNLTKEAQEKAAALVESQKTRLKGGLETGVKGLEESYTTAPKGQESRLAKAQRELKEKYDKTIAPAKEQMTKDIEQKVKAAEQKIYMDAYNRIAEQPVPNQIAFDAYGNPDWGRVAQYRQGLLEKDPTYQRQKAALEGEAGKEFRRLSPSYQELQGKQPLIEGNVPTLELQNIISSEDAQKYNRLQALLGGQAVKPTAADITPASYDKAAVQTAYENLLRLLG